MLPLVFPPAWRKSTVACTAGYDKSLGDVNDRNKEYDYGKSHRELREQLNAQQHGQVVVEHIFPFYKRLPMFNKTSTSIPTILEKPCNSPVTYITHRGPSVACTLDRSTWWPSKATT